VAFTLPRLPPGVVSPEFQIWWQQVVEAVEAEVGALEAADAANAAAVLATAAAAAANTAATNAQTTADDITASSSLANSYVTGTPPIVSAIDAGADATITIAAHTRHYPQPDGSTVDVAVTGGSLTGLAYSTFYYIYYDDASRTGGAVTYHATTSADTAAQLGDRHTVGAVTTPAAAGPPEDGGFTRPPGSGQFPSQ
jgi:hypothetical protein